jgi:hypothetical protein
VDRIEHGVAILFLICHLPGCYEIDASIS